MLKYLFALLSYSILFASISQSNQSDLKTMTRKEISSYYITQLKKGSLLVRLQTKQRKIDILKKIGNFTAAEKVRLEQIKINTFIIKAFKERFYYCPTYFFYSHDSKFVASHQLDSVVFLNSNLNPVDSIKPKQISFYLTAEFGIIKEDTASINQRHKAIESVKRTEYTNGSTMSFKALLIKSDQFIQLGRPFPYYVRTLSSIPVIKRSHSRTVHLMNDYLNKFFSETR